MDKYGKTQKSKFILELDNILCSTVMSGSKYRTSEHLIEHNKLNNISINIHPCKAIT